MLLEKSREITPENEETDGAKVKTMASCGGDW